VYHPSYDKIQYSKTFMFKKLALSVFSGEKGRKLPLVGPVDEAIVARV
jgi:hypothetical protein